MQCLHSQTTFAKRLPHVIVILTDDMGYGDISSFYDGSIIKTPHIDRLAQNGLTLTQYYSAAPICSPSRAAILTGNYPGRWNFCTFLDTKKHNRDAGQADFLDPSAPSMARFFKNAGYATGHFGKWHLGGGRDVTNAPGFKNYGFDAYASTYESPEPDNLLTATQWIWSDKDSIKRWDRSGYFVDRTLDFLAKHKDQPCFINLWPDDVHTPWVPKPSADTAGYPKNRQGKPAFEKVLREYDLQIGRLLDGLKKMGIAENTVIIFTSDNGPLPSFQASRAAGLRGTKLSLYEGGIRMPFIISWPGQIKAGTRDTVSMITGVDLLPSLFGLCQLQLPQSYKSDGTDRSAVFKGKASVRRADMYWDYGRNQIAYAYPKGRDRSPNLAIRSGEWKLLVNDDGSDPQLYQVIKDPGETHNLAGEFPDIARALQVKLLQWRKQLPELKSTSSYSF
jgi:arylsulfatase A-like enzyme